MSEELETYDVYSGMSIDQLFEHASRLDDEIKARTAEIIEPLEGVKHTIEAKIRDLALAQGGSISTANGTVSYRAAGESTKWDDKKLLALVADLAASAPEVAGKIMACRTTTPTKAGTAISYKARPA